MGHPRSTPTAVSLAETRETRVPGNYQPMMIQYRFSGSTILSPLSMIEPENTAISAYVYHQASLTSWRRAPPEHEQDTASIDRRNRRHLADTANMSRIEEGRR